MPVYRQLKLFDDLNDLSTKDNSSSTFIDNMKLPVHRWFRYSAGFSAEWVSSLISNRKDKQQFNIIDPFSGSGTVMLEADFSGVHSKGIESHPFISRIANAKLLWWEDTSAFEGFCNKMLGLARSYKIGKTDYPKLLTKCYPDDILRDLESLRIAFEYSSDGSSASELAWLALVSIIRICSPAGTAQWQYVLPKKSKAKFERPYNAFSDKVRLMLEDMKFVQRNVNTHKAKQYIQDARIETSIPDGWADMIITSPPYANNYDYGDATRLEMTFMRQIESWGDLQKEVRTHLVRSCTQHVSGFVNDTFDIIDDPVLIPIQNEIREVCHKLEKERLQHGGKKNYHTMVATYFLDLGIVWKRLRRITKKGGEVCFVIGDSAPYGIYVPVDDWLGKLALSAGFNDYFFEKTRDRNIKWKNRKHRVPLKEGRLWVRG